MSRGGKNPSAACFPSLQSSSAAIEILRFLPKTYLLSPETWVQQTLRKCRAEPCAEHSAQAESGHQEDQDRVHLALLPATVIKQYRHNQWGLPSSSSEELFNCKHNSTHMILSVLLERSKSWYAELVGVASIAVNPQLLATKVDWQCLPQSSQAADRHANKFCFTGDSYQAAQCTQKTEHEGSAPSHPRCHSHPDPLYRCSTLHRLEDPWAQGQGPAGSEWGNFAEK